MSHFAWDIEHQGRRDRVEVSIRSMSQLLETLNSEASGRICHTKRRKGVLTGTYRASSRSIVLNHIIDVIGLKLEHDKLLMKET